MPTTQLFQQPFSTNIRTISGLVNFVAQDDYVILCDTSTGAVQIELPTIPPNFWSAQWRISIVDASFNASVNPITITAPIGYSINGQNSASIVSNGAGYVIIVSNNTNYAGLYSGVISGTTSVGLINITNAGLLALISAGTISAGQFYFVNNVSNVSFANGEGVAVQGIKVNGLTTIEGSGSFFNADYQGVGNYSGVSNYVNNIGIWSSSTPAPFVQPPSFVQFSIVIYNNLHYQNLTGTYGSTTPDLDGVNWLLLPKSKTNGYILVQDSVKYDVVNNVVVYRADERNNEVDRYVSGGFDSLAIFQWGRDVVKNNKLRGNSLMKTTNSYCSFNGNILENGILQDGTNYKVVSAGAYNGNTIIEGASVTMLFSASAPIGNGRNAGTIANNHFGNGVTIRFTEVATGISFLTNTMEVVNSNLGNLTTSITNKRCVSGFSNFEAILQYPTHWKNPNQLLIPASYINQYNWVGIFFLRDIPDFMDEIDGLPTNHISTFYVFNTGVTELFQINAISTATALQIVGNDIFFPTIPQNYPFTQRNNGNDYFQMQKSGNLNQVVLYNTMA
jgi:hypothetical protein